MTATSPPPAPGAAAPAAIATRPRRVPVDLVLGIDPTAPEPLHRQLYGRLREAILERRLKPGARLPSTRALAAMLGLARNTVHGAYDQLLAEGYVEAHHGSGTYVASSLPDDAFRAAHSSAGPRSAAVTPPASALPGPALAPVQPGWPPSGAEARSESSGQARLSTWGRRVADLEPPPYAGVSGLPFDFRHGRPDAAHFPTEEWRRAGARQLRRVGRADLWYGPPAGLPALREAIAEYLGRARGVRCAPEHVLVTTGTQQAVDLLARLLVDDGDRIVVEDPSYPGARRVFEALGAQIVDVPVDDHGLCTAALPDAPARLVYTTPSHQYPSGATLPVSRRLELLAWAERRDALVVEDDYDSEFRYVGRPLEAMQGLDRSARVIYVGTFSKVLYPALRLGYVVLPPWLARPAVEAKRLLDLQTATPPQEILAELIQSGAFEAHMRRMRRLYRARRAALLDALARELSQRARPGPSEAGLFLRLVLAEGIDEEAVVRRAATLGVAVYSARPYYARPIRQAGLILGYAALDEAAIAEGIRRLRLAVEGAD